MNKISNYHHIYSSVGGANIGQSVKFRDELLHPNLEAAGWFDVYIYGITGKRFKSESIALLEAIWVCTSYPDPRIWNNRVACLVGSTRGTAGLAVSSALAVSEAEIFGGGINIRAASFLQEVSNIIDPQALYDFVMTELKTNRSIAGYGRPLASADERIPSIFRTMEKLNIEKGPHIKAAYAVEGVLLKNRTRLHMNYAAVAAAICLDLGLTPEEFYLFCIPSFMAGFLPCFLEGRSQAPNTMFQAGFKDIEYLNKSTRAW